MLNTPEQMPNNEPHRPLVTFALFAYNQEDFIREAIEGAFAQTYEPLEIILSDDCSSDRTFEIMQEMAASYEGPHQVTARQTPRNSGTLSHVLQVSKESGGKLLILAAGDDVSKANRTTRIFEEWQKSGAWGICSDFSEIDANGKIIAEHSHSKSIQSPSYHLKKYMLGQGKGQPIIHGATSAYDKALFDKISLSSEEYIISEDGALSLILHILRKKILHIHEPLIDYRSHPESITNSKGYHEASLEQVRISEENISRHARSQANRCKFLIESHNRLVGEGLPARLDVDLINNDFHRKNLVSQWYDLTFKERIVGTIKAKNRSSFLWSAPRLLPKRLFIRIKYIGKVIRKLNPR